MASENLVKVHSELWVSRWGNVWHLTIATLSAAGRPAPPCLRGCVCVWESGCMPLQRTVSPPQRKVSHPSCFPSPLNRVYRVMTCRHVYADMFQFPTKKIITSLVFIFVNEWMSSLISYDDGNSLMMPACWEDNCDYIRSCITSNLSELLYDKVFPTSQTVQRWWVQGLLSFWEEHVGWVSQGLQ